MSLVLGAADRQNDWSSGNLILFGGIAASITCGGKADIAEYEGNLLAFLIPA